MSKEQTDLAGCPFCGGPATHQHAATDEHRIICRSRQCFGPATSWYGLADDAVFMWNRRASPSPAGGVQAVTDEMVERAFDAFLAAYSLPYEPGKDPRDGVRAALTAALSSQAQTTGGVE